jgi:hypothetical protein
MGIDDTKSANDFYEDAKKSIGRIVVCEAYIYSAKYNLKMATTYTLIVNREMQRLIDFIEKEILRQMSETLTRAKGSAFVRDKETSSIFNSLQEVADALLSGGEAATLTEGDAHTLSGGEIPEITNLSAGKVHIVNTINNNIEGGSNDMEEIRNKTNELKENASNYKSIEVLKETVKLMQAALLFIIQNEENSTKEMHIGKEALKVCLVFGHPLEDTFSTMQFNSSTLANFDKNNVTAINMFNENLRKVCGSLDNLYSASGRLKDDLQDVQELVQQVRDIVFAKSANKKTSILKFFASNVETPEKRNLILDSLQSVFFNFDFAIHFATNSFANIDAVRELQLKSIKFPNLPVQTIEAEGNTVVNE